MSHTPEEIVDLAVIEKGKWNEERTFWIVDPRDIHRMLDSFELSIQSEEHVFRYLISKWGFYPRRIIDTDIEYFGCLAHYIAPHMILYGPRIRETSQRIKAGSRS